MSGETVLRIQPGESTEDFIHRVADTAPPLTPELAARLRSLLPATRQEPAGRPVDRPPVRAAA